MDVYVKMEGVISEKYDVSSNWAIGGMLPTAREALTFAKSFGNVYVYGDVCIGLKGQRAVQRWIYANDLGDLVFWVTPHNTPPEGDDIEVIDQWPMNENTPSS